ncbi:MAG TPA: MOSC domain-containing protein [Thermoplasmata archaeon]|nr:MOSC domain-containing protein [Thermoplasmata archaeon]
MGSIVRVSRKPEPSIGTGLRKPAVGSATITPAGVAGDFNRYRHERLADDPDSAVLLIPSETLDALNAEGWPVQPGDLGENITTRGIPYDALMPGTRVSTGTVVLQISRACDPCTNLYELPYVGSQRGPAFIKTMKGRRGWYARVLRGGVVSTGDRIAVEASAQ